MSMFKQSFTTRLAKGGHKYSGIIICIDGGIRIIASAAAFVDDMLTRRAAKKIMKAQQGVK